MLAKSRKRQRDRPDDDVGEELQRDDQRPHEHGHAGRQRGVLEVAAEAVLGDADAVVDDPDHDGQTVGPAGVRGGRQQGEREDAPQVVDQDEREQRDQQGQELAEVVTERVPGDGVADEEVGRLADELALARHHLFLRAITSQKIRIKITATIACSMYLSSQASHGTSGNSGGRSKLSGRRGAGSPRRRSPAAAAPWSAGSTRSLSSRCLVRARLSGRRSGPRPGRTAG